jgi:hypothetical protein
VSEQPELDEDQRRLRSRAPMIVFGCILAIAMTTMTVTIVGYCNTKDDLDKTIKVRWR